MKFLRASMKKELSDQLHSTGQQEKVKSKGRKFRDP